MGGDFVAEKRLDMIYPLANSKICRIKRSEEYEAVSNSHCPRCKRL